MREVEVAIGKTLESDSRYASLLKEYDQLQHDFNDQNGCTVILKMKFVVFYMDLNLTKAFMIKRSVLSLVVRKHVWLWLECC